MLDTKKTILQKDFQIGRPICKSAGQSVIGRLVSEFAYWPDWQIGRNIYGGGPVSILFTTPSVGFMFRIIA